jgi:hypothetical protein
MTITLGKLIERLEELRFKSKLGNDTPIYLCYDEVGGMPVTVDIQKLPLGINYNTEYPEVIFFVNGPKLQADYKERDNAKEE